MVIKKSITLEMAHRLPNHSGKCHNIHGHSWQLTVCIAGTPKESEKEEGGPRESDEGMVVDFSVLKEALKKIEDRFDHTLVIAGYDPIIDVLAPRGKSNPADMLLHWGRCLSTEWGPLIAVPFAPTSENLAKLWCEMLTTDLPHLQIVQVIVKETANSEVNWCPLETGF
jgi:6-pyruvoyltetrahydropterin/6-carboxytetrahydropterin synthase